MTTTDIVERLQVHADIMARDKGKYVRFIDAADCVEAAATITELREELRQIYVDATEQHEDWCNMGPVDDEARDWAFGISQIAIEALKESTSAALGDAS